MAAVTRDHDDRHVDRHVIQSAQQFDAAHLRHPDVGDNATAFAGFEIPQEGCRGIICPDVDIRSPKQKFERTSHGVVVINDMHQIAVSHCSGPLRSLAAG